MLDCHVNAYLIQPGRVLGRKLRHLTLRHLWLLEACESPYATGQPTVYADMVFAVLMLSLPFRTARWLLMHVRCLRLLVSIWSWRYKGSDMAGEMAAFRKYWSVYTDMPSQYDAGGKRIPSCLPLSVSVAWAIMGKVGERRAWSMPLPLALTYFVAEREAGGSEYSTESDKAQAKHNAEAEAAHG